MRICLLIGGLGAGGAERVMTVMANHWAAQRHQVHLLTLEGDTTPPFYALHPTVCFQALGIDGWQPSPWRRLRATLRRIQILRGALRATRCQVVIAFMDRTNILAIATMIGLRIPLIIAQRVDPRHHPIGNLWAFLRRISYRFATALICQTREVAQHFTPIAPARCAIIPNPVQAARAARQGEAPVSGRIFALGRLETQKGFDCLIEALPRIVTHCPKAHVVIVGAGSQEEALRAQAQRLGMHHRVDIRPPVSDPSPLFHSAECFALPSRYEGFPNALCEAMAHGLPVIAFDCPSGPRDIIHQGWDGILVPPGNVPALAESIITVLTDPVYRQALRSRAPEIVSRFGIKQIMAAWIAMIERVIETPKRPPYPRHTAVPGIAFLIPTRNRHDALRRSLPLVLAAARRVGATIIICDQSAQPLAAAPGIRVLHRPDVGGLPAARNVLLRATDADVVCFLDDDTDVAADFAERALALAVTEPDVVAWGPVVETRSRAVRRLHRLAHLGVFADPRRLTAARGDRSTSALFGCCFVVRRAAALAVGFDARRPGYALGEDLDFFRRLPGPKRFAATLRAIHRREDAQRADPAARGAAKARFLRWLAARHGGRNPATLVHLGLAMLAAASGAGQEPGSQRGVWAGIRATGLRSHW